MQKQILIKKIIEYINAAYEWHEDGDSSLDDGIGQTMAVLEEEILTAFGLPFMAWQYSDIMQEQGFLDANVEERAEMLFEKLKMEAQKFLLAPIEKDTTLLKEARSILQDAVEVLPLIGITTTNYNLFLYYEIFFRGIYNEEEIAPVLRKAEELDELPETRVPYKYDALIDDNNLGRLKKAGLPFLDEYKEYLRYIECKQNWEEYPGNRDLGDYLGLPYNFALDHFIITHIHVNNKETCYIKVLKPLGENSLVELTLYCRKDILKDILLHAKYYSLSVPNLYLASPHYLNERETTIPLKRVIRKDIEIEKMKIEIERIDNDEDEKPDPFRYVVKAITASENIPEFSFKEPEDDWPF